MIGSGSADSGSIPPVFAGRRSRILPAPGDRRGFWIAAVSTVFSFAALGWLIVSSPGWPTVQKAFFDPDTFVASWPRVTGAFWINVQLFLLAEALVLVLALIVAVLRSLPGAALAPVRLLATAYVDLFRALPGILVISILGFGIPALEAMSAGVPVVVSNRGALPEVVGDAGLLIDPDDAESLAAALERLADDPDLRATCARRGLDRARQFTWTQTARNVRRAYEDAQLAWRQRAPILAGARSSVHSRNAHRH